jgi:hypothetical protein
MEVSGISATWHLYTSGCPVAFISFCTLLVPGICSLQLNSKKANRSHIYNFPFTSLVSHKTAVKVELRLLGCFTVCLL